MYYLTPLDFSTTIVNGVFAKCALRLLFYVTRVCDLEPSKSCQRLSRAYHRESVKQKSLIARTVWLGDI